MLAYSVLYLLNQGIFKCYYYECAECLSNIDCGFDEVSDNTILSDFNSMFSSIAHQQAIHAGLGMIETAADQESAYWPSTLYLKNNSNVVMILVILKYTAAIR